MRGIRRVSKGEQAALPSASDPHFRIPSERPIRTRGRSSGLQQRFLARRPSRTMQWSARAAETAAGAAGQLARTSLLNARISSGRTFARFRFFDSIAHFTCKVNRHGTVGRIIFQNRRDRRPFSQKIAAFARVRRHIFVAICLIFCYNANEFAYANQKGGQHAGDAVQCAQV